YLVLSRNLSNDVICPIVDTVLDRFCSQILPQIRYKINFLTLETSSVERILLTADYPNLYGLGLYNIDEKSAKRFFTVELHITVEDFNDCLYLLNGRLSQLRTFYVKIYFFFLPSEVIKEKKSLPNMKCFSLMCKSEILCYNKSIVSLLQRMTNLEELALYIFVGQRTCLDGNCLKNDIINHLPRLNKFTFNIRSFIYDLDQADLLSNEYIQDTFKGLGDIQVISCVDYFPKQRTGQCHFYSYPYTLTYYNNITNNFTDGLFKFVREVSLFDEHPFEHEFFIRIARAFPLLENLSMINQTQQKQKLNNNNEHLSIIEYLHLNQLRFIDTHDDYVEQFLVNTNTCLPKNIRLFIHYDSLKRVTNNFTRVATRVNCCKINCLRIYNQFQISKRLTNYFPNAKILI
ncbi:unnamed protein product, partial [Rotaria sp. Silwood2]